MNAMAFGIDRTSSVTGHPGAAFSAPATQTRSLGPFQISRTAIAAGASLFTRPRTALEDRYVWRTLVSGRLTVAEGAHLIALEAGDVVLGDGFRAASFACEQPGALVELWVGERELRRHFASPAEIVGLKLCGRHPVVRTASTMLRCLWEAAGPGLGPDAGSRLVDSALVVISTAGVPRAPGSPAVSRISRIKCHIERNLSDPLLGVRSVAAAFRISPRYLHHLFEEEGESISCYIMRRRLEQCAGQLRDPMLRGRTITQIAFDWGFNSMPHFARVFRRRYGVAARDYRRMAPLQGAFVEANAARRPEPLGGAGLSRARRAP